VDDDDSIGEQRPDHWPRYVPASGRVDARNEKAPDAVQRLLQRRHAAGKDRRMWPGAPKPSGNHRDAGIVQKQLRELGVVAAPSALMARETSANA